ncbi:MAG: CBS domain-containing protein [Desulfobacteraceae bacterium]|nr:MAG: CBS domain-containing protein [Desulfobacteraceae bacterium]
MRVDEFMTTKIETIDANGTVYDAVETMVNRRIRSVVVMAPGTESVDGVVTARDVVFKVLAKGLNPKNVKVSDIASRPIVCASGEMDFEDVATLMEKSNIARVFICEEGKVRGLVSLLDLMAAELIMRARGDHDL